MHSLWTIQLNSVENGIFSTNSDNVKIDFECFNSMDSYVMIIDAELRIARWTEFKNLGNSQKILYAILTEKVLKKLFIIKYSWKFWSIELLAFFKTLNFDIAKLKC